jgi:hypothetical protein
MRALRRCAHLLEVNPQKFIDWILEYEIENLLSAGGMLCNWADDMLVYKTPASRFRVMENVRPFRFEEGRVA